MTLDFQIDGNDAFSFGISYKTECAIAVAFRFNKASATIRFIDMMRPLLPTSPSLSLHDATTKWHWENVFGEAYHHCKSVDRKYSFSKKERANENKCLFLNGNKWL